MNKKTITFIRHSKSSWDYPDLKDFDRPLNERGYRDAPFMGKKLVEYGAHFDLIISSPSKRTTLTMENICGQIDYSFEKIQWDTSVFHSTVDNLLRLISELDENVNSVAIVGHNPSMTIISNQLQKDKEIENVPTTGIVCISFSNADWDEIPNSTGKLEYFIYPKKFK